MVLPDAPADVDDTYWNSHWQRYSEATRLNPGQRYRRKCITRMLGSTAGLSGATILDVGSGAGDLLEMLSRKFPNAELAGIDRSDKGLEVSKQLLPNSRLRKVDLDADQTVPPDLEKWASHIVCSEVLEHMERPLLVLKKLADYMKPGGTLVITVPGGPKSAFDRSIGHFRHYTPAHLRRDLEDAGYRVDLATGSGFPMFNLYRLVILMRGEKLHQDIDGKPGPLARCVMAAFRAVIGCSFFASPWGWQVIAIARKPGERFR